MHYTWSAVKYKDNIKGALAKAKTSSVAVEPIAEGDSTDRPPSVPAELIAKGDPTGGASAMGDTREPYVCTSKSIWSLLILSAIQKNYGFTLCDS